MVTGFNLRRRLWNGAKATVLSGYIRRCGERKDREAIDSLVLQAKHLTLRIRD
jgi:hypothetical protein